MIDYEKIAEQMPPSRERTAILRLYGDIKHYAGYDIREQAARYRDSAIHMSGPGGVNDTYEGMNKKQVLEKSRLLFAQAEQAEKEAIYAYETKQNEDTNEVINQFVSEMTNNDFDVVSEVVLIKTTKEPQENNEVKPGTPPEIKVRRENKVIIVTSTFPYSGEVLEKVIFQRELEAILKLLESERNKEA